MPAWRTPYFAPEYSVLLAVGQLSNCTIQDSMTLDHRSWLAAKPFKAVALTTLSSGQSLSRMSPTTIQRSGSMVAVHVSFVHR